MLMNGKSCLIPIIIGFKEKRFKTKDTILKSKFEENSVHQISSLLLIFQAEYSWLV